METNKISLFSCRLSEKSLSVKIKSPLLVILLLIGLFLVTGLIGINFGEQWDEYIHYYTVTCSLKSKILLPCSNVPELVEYYGNAYYNYIIMMKQ